MNNYIAISSLAMDLKRAALGLYGGSFSMADRFLLEAKKRKSEINLKAVKPYIINILDNIEVMSHEKDKKKEAEDALMYSTLLQNYCVKEMKAIESKETLKKALE